MSAQIVEFTIDGKECMAEKGQYILAAARENGIYIPTLCNLQGIKPRGSCRICNVKVNGRYMTACTTPVNDGMTIENNTEDLNALRKAIVEILFAEGNHFCPACERSGSCELQALAYRYRVMAPRFPLQFPKRDIEASNPYLIKDHNRCILCKRCIRAIKDAQGRSIFAFNRRGHKVMINIDTKLGMQMNEELATHAAEVCPVGAILKRETGFRDPIGRRKYDNEAIGSEIEKVKV